jgi:hypothetical protein
MILASLRRFCNSHALLVSAFAAVAALLRKPSLVLSMRLTFISLLSHSS